MWHMQIRRLIYAAGTFGLCITSSFSRGCAQAGGGKTDFSSLSAPKQSGCTVCRIILPKPKHTGVWLFYCRAHSSDSTMCASESQSTCGDAGGAVCALIKPWSVWRPACIVPPKGTSTTFALKCFEDVGHVTLILQNISRVDEGSLKKETVMLR